MYNFPSDLLESIEFACDGVNVKLVHFPAEEGATVFLVPLHKKIDRLRIWYRGGDYKIEHGDPAKSGRIVATPYKSDVLHEVDLLIAHIEAIEKLENVNNIQEDPMRDSDPFPPLAESAEDAAGHFAGKVALMAYGLVEEEPSREDIIALAQTCSFLAARILELYDRIDSGEAR